MDEMIEKNHIEAEEVATRERYHHGDLRAQLLVAVRELVDEKGAENFSIAEAARRAKVSSAAPYRHFADKPEILRAVVFDSMDAMEQSMREAIATLPVGSLERIEALGHCYINYAVKHPGQFRLVFGISESHDGDEKLQEKGACVFGIVVQTAADFLEVPPDDLSAKRLAYLLWTVVHGHSFLRIDGKAEKEDFEFPDTDLMATLSRMLISQSKTDLSNALTEPRKGTD